VFLTPELKPFFGGTYFPPDQRSGRPSFRQLLQQIAQLWQTRRSEVTNSAADIHARLEEASANHSLSNLLLTAEVVRQAGVAFKRSYDARNGGFGDAPKFPQPSQRSSWRATPNGSRMRKRRRWSCIPVSTWLRRHP